MPGLGSLGGGVVVQYGTAWELPTRCMQLDELQQGLADGWSSRRVEECVAHRRQQLLELVGQLRLKVASDVCEDKE